MPTGELHVIFLAPNRTAFLQDTNRILQANLLRPHPTRPDTLLSVFPVPSRGERLLRRLGTVRRSRLGWAYLLLARGKVRGEHRMAPPVRPRGQRLTSLTIGAEQEAAASAAAAGSSQINATPSIGDRSFWPLWASLYCIVWGAGRSVNRSNCSIY